VTGTDRSNSESERALCKRGGKKLGQGRKEVLRGSNAKAIVLRKPEGRSLRADLREGLIVG